MPLWHPSHDRHDLACAAATSREPDGKGDRIADHHICRRKLGLPVAASAPPPPAPRQRPVDIHGGTCGPKALAAVCAALGVRAAEDELAAAAGSTPDGTNLAGLAIAAKMKGLQAQGVHVDIHALRKLDKRAVAWVDGNHFVALLHVDCDTATIRDPNRDRDEAIPTDELLRRSGGILLLVEPRRIGHGRSR